MSFVVQNADNLRDTILELAAAHYAEFGGELDTAPESDAYRMASAFALALEVLHAHALKVEASIFPDTALTDDLEHHAAIFGLSRKPATAARLVVMVSNGGVGVNTYALAGETLNHSDGTKYKPINSDGTPRTSVTTGLLGTADILCEAQTAGTVGNKGVPTSLIWSSTPAGLLATGSVVGGSGLRFGTEAELDAALAQRLLAYLRSRPAAGNCADWQTWALEVAGSIEAWVYPATNPDAATTNATPGAVTVVVMGDRTVGNGLLDTNQLARIKGYIEGDNDAEGNTLEGDSRSRQKRFASLASGDIQVLTPTSVSQNVYMDVVVRGESVPTWSPLTTDAGCTTSVLNTTVNPVTAGVTRNQWVAVFNASVPGLWEARNVVDCDATSITLSPELATAPGAGVSIRRAWSGWDAARDAIVSVFRALGPGDYSSGAGGPTRFPDTTESGPDRLYTSALVSVVVGVPQNGVWSSGVPGVVSATVTTPAADVQENPFELLVPQEIRFTPTGA